MVPEEYALVQEIKKFARQKMNQIADAMAIGECKDWADYRFMVGQVQAYAITERELLDLLERVEQKIDDGED